ncbi:Fe-S protein [Candidatus Endobugula sertula]|uniref:Fe-S protein n=1 Tax=Candidatus Endobugula sertula TaxID=62101 RepID=A0A1D2QN60_9GAMM|nr:Fe-S protein [Candidatus Endobugula sertula]
MVKTPCIGVCSTSIGDLVCRGCKRFAHEVISWNGYTEEQRQLVVGRLDGFLVTIVANKIDIISEEKLIQQMSYQQIKVDQTLSPARWVYELLRAGAAQIKDTEAYGFRVKEAWQRFSLEQLKQFLDQDFYTLSSAHYDCYIANHRGSYPLQHDNDKQ